MHIAYFVNQYPKVSHTFIRREIKALEAAGIQVDRFALRSDRTELVDAEDIEEFEKTRYLLKAGIGRIFIACIGSLALQPLAFFSTLLNAYKLGRQSTRGVVHHFICFVEACILKHWARHSGVTHVHAHFGTNSVTIAMLAKQLGGASYSFTTHGPEEFDSPIALALGEKVHHSKFTVAISSFCRSQIFRWVDVADWDKIHIVRCALDATSFVANPPPVPVAKRLVCVGRLSPDKGQLMLLRAVRLLKERGVNIELVLAGDGPLRSQLEEKIAEYHLHQQVRITGWIDNQQVRSELQQARALVLPSFAEGLPVVIMEALAASRPVISTYIAGIPELVEDQVSGWLIPAGDITRLTDAILDAVTADPERLAQMGAHGRKRASELHNVDIEAEKLGELFRTATDSSLHPSRCKADLSYCER